MRGIEILISGIVVPFRGSESYLMGKDNDLLIRNKEDFRFFKEQTEGNIIIMGRKTFESMGNKPLRGRVTIVVSSDETVVGNTLAIHADSFIDAIKITEDLYETDGPRQIFLVGGASLIRSALRDFRLGRLGKHYISKINISEFKDSEHAKAFLDDNSEYVYLTDECFIGMSRKLARYEFGGAIDRKALREEYASYVAAKRFNESLVNNDISEIEIK